MIQVWKCDHCSKIAQDKDVIRRHEKECDWDERRKTCFTCEHQCGDINGDTFCNIGVKFEGKINKFCGKWVEMFDFS